MNNSDLCEIIYDTIENYLVHTPVPGPTDALRISCETKDVDIVKGADIEDLDHERFDYYCLLGLIDWSLDFEGPEPRGDRIWEIGKGEREIIINL